MNKAQAAELVRTMMRPYNTTVDTKLFESWWNTSLENTDYELGEQIVQELVGENKFPPRPAEFNEARRRRKAAQRSSMEITEGNWEANKELAEKQLAEMRGKLRGNT